jgi:hypothetical protein
VPSAVESASQHARVIIARSQFTHATTAWDSNHPLTNTSAQNAMMSGMTCFCWSRSENLKSLPEADCAACAAASI